MDLLYYGITEKENANDSPDIERQFSAEYEKKRALYDAIPLGHDSLLREKIEFEIFDEIYKENQNKV